MKPSRPGKTLCASCVPKRSALAAKRIARYRDEVFTALGDRCQCDGEGCWHEHACEVDDRRALTVDHADGDGAEHRREMSPKWTGATRAPTGAVMWRAYAIAVRTDGRRLRILCANCHHVKDLRRGEAGTMEEERRRGRRPL